MVVDVSADLHSGSPVKSSVEKIRTTNTYSVYSSTAVHPDVKEVCFFSPWVGTASSRVDMMAAARH